MASQSEHNTTYLAPISETINHAADPLSQEDNITTIPESSSSQPINLPSKLEPTITVRETADSESMSSSPVVGPATPPLDPYEPKEPRLTTVRTSTTIKEPELPWYSFKPIPWYRPLLLTFAIVYMANIIAWGGMLFLLLVEAAPAMCHPTCNDLYSPRRIWIETDSQILNGLFCVTGFGLAPWRFRDMFFLARLYLGPKKNYAREHALLRVVGFNSWFRVGQGMSEQEARVLQARVRPLSYFSLKWLGTEPRPLEEVPDIPQSLHLATSPKWKLWGVIFLNFMNTAFQICLATFMWVDNRFQRPSWATGLFVALGCLAGIFAGVIQGGEGSRAAKVEQGIEKKKKEKKKKKKKDAAKDEEAQIGV